MENYLKIFEPIAQSMGVKIASSKMVSNDMLEINLDSIEGDTAIDLDTCTKVAQAFAEAIDYAVGLDVASKGAEPEIESADYESVIGSYVFVKFKQPKEGNDKVEGELIEVNDDSIVVSYRFKHTSKKMKVERENIGLLRLAVKF